MSWDWVSFSLTLLYGMGCLWLGYTARKGSASITKLMPLDENTVLLTRVSGEKLHMLNMTKFARYLNEDESKKIFAAPVIEEDAETIRKHWVRKDEVQELEAGDYILLRGNGDIGVIKKAEFESVWHLAVSVSTVELSL